MSDFERVYQIDPEREKDHQREKHPSFELSDQEYLEKNRFTKTCNKPPLIPMDLEMPVLEEAIRKGKNEQKKSKSSKGKPKKSNPKSNKAAVASIREKLS